MTKVLGLDVSRGRVSACLLTELPPSPREYFRAHRGAIIDLPANKAGIEVLLSMGCSHAAMEPTGVHYSRLWADYLYRAGVKILWVGHSQLCATRKAYRLPGKNDHADALALAYYGLEHLEEPEWFINFDLFSEAYQLRQCCLEIQHLERRSVVVKNRLRQQLCHEWPEVAEVRTNGALWRFIAGRPLDKRTESRYNRRLLTSVGLGLSEFSRFQSQQLCDIEEEIERIEQKLIGLTKRPEFEKYRITMRPFDFGPRIEALLLAHIYPFENFLSSPDRREIIEWVSRGPGLKRTKRNRSLKSFKLKIGLGLVEDSSGKKQAWVAGGSKLCRQALWQYCFTRIEPRHARPKSEVGQRLGEYCDRLKALKLSPKLVRSKVCVKVGEALYKALLMGL